MDIGALTREFFWKGIQSLVNDKMDGKKLFEGEADHLLPTVDSILLRSGIFSTVGKFIAHSIIHCGIGLIGISTAAAQYLTTEHIDADTPFNITEQDIADVNVREAITLMF